MGFILAFWMGIILSYYLFDISADSSSQQPEFEFILFVLSWKC
jgi:hypothetical protein